MVDSLEAFPSSVVLCMAGSAFTTEISLICVDPIHTGLSHCLHSSHYLLSMFHLPQKSLLENHCEITSVFKRQVENLKS